MNLLKDLGGIFVLKKLKTESRVENEPVNMTVIGEHITIEDAKITGAGDVCIDGVVKGIVNIKGQFIIGETGSLYGDVTADAAVISGRIKGNMIINGVLQLTETAVVEGEVQYQRIIVVAGAHLQGRCAVLASNKAIESLDEVGESDDLDEVE